jgi:hypothetical protein
MKMGMKVLKSERLLIEIKDGEIINLAVTDPDIRLKILDHDEARVDDNFNILSLTPKVVTIESHTGINKLIADFIYKNSKFY